MELEVKGYIPYISAESVVLPLGAQDASIDVKSIRKRNQDNSCLLPATTHSHTAPEDTSDTGFFIVIFVVFFLVER